MYKSEKRDFKEFYNAYAKREYDIKPEYNTYFVQDVDIPWKSFGKFRKILMAMYKIDCLTE